MTDRKPKPRRTRIQALSEALDRWFPRGQQDEPWQSDYVYRDARCPWCSGRMHYVVDGRLIGCANPLHKPEEEE